MEETPAERGRQLSEAISPHPIQLSRHVRQLARNLRDKTRTTPYAADSLILANEVDGLCDYVEQLHGDVKTLLTQIDTAGDSAARSGGGELSSEDKKAMEIQREIHELHPTALDTIKALFMWRDSPEQRLRDDK